MMTHELVRLKGHLLGDRQTKASWEFLNQSTKKFQVANESVMKINLGYYE